MYMPQPNHPTVSALDLQTAAVLRQKAFDEIKGRHRGAEGRSLGKQKSL